MWRLERRWVNHCPGDCYLFYDDEDKTGRCHIPTVLFWGGTIQAELTVINNSVLDYRMGDC